MNIVRATLGDLEDVSVLFDGYRVFYRQETDLARAREFMGERLRRGDSVIFIARDEVGTATGFTQLYPVFSSVSTGRVWLLNDLFVAENARRSGTGAALLGAARDFGRETGALRIELATEHTNTTAQALYEREGYQLETKFRRYSLALEA